MSAAKRRRSLAGPGAEGERRHGFRAVGLAVSKLAGPIVAKRGGGILARLKVDWAAIVGAEWSAAAWPAALGRDGALKLRTAPAAALELQHRSPLLIERVNLYFGRPVVTRLVLVQGSWARAPQRGRPQPRPLAAGEVRGLDRQLSAIAEPELRAALDRLGRAVIGAGR
jgi:hypothetical protein